MQDEVTVTQVDERAVAEFHRQSLKALFATTDADIDAGINRAHTLLCQAFARHRHQAERETLARMEWRDIESAPKDGTWFLAYEPDGERGAHYACSFYGDDEYRGILWRSACGQYVTSSPEPTHWMPLPPAPEAGQ